MILPPSLPDFPPSPSSISPSSPPSSSTDVFKHLDGEMLTQLKVPAFKPDSSIFILQMPGDKKKEDQVFKCLKLFTDPQN